MARPTEPGDQPELGPNQPYPPPGGPQFPPAQYPYHPTSQYPNLDQDLNMADTYGQQNIASQLQEAAANAPRNGGMNVMNVDTNGSAPAGMAPPDTPHQGTFSPAGGRASVDETADAAEHGDSKRKRSKVSRVSHSSDLTRTTAAQVIYDHVMKFCCLAERGRRSLFIRF